MTHHVHKIKTSKAIKYRPGNYRLFSLCHRNVVFLVQDARFLQPFRQSFRFKLKQPFTVKLYFLRSIIIFYCRISSYTKVYLKEILTNFLILEQKIWKETFLRPVIRTNVRRIRNGLLEQDSVGYFILVFRFSQFCEVGIQEMDINAFPNAYVTHLGGSPYCRRISVIWQPCSRGLPSGAFSTP